MKCRRINPDNGMIVWFGVKNRPVPLLACGNDKTCGAPYSASGISMDVITVLNSDRTVFQDEANKHANYATGSEGVANSLRQRLSVLKHELWYDYNRGMPLPDKARSKAIVDAYIIQTILEHPDVIDVEGFESEQERNNYTCYFIVNTIYGQIELGM